MKKLEDDNTKLKYRVNHLRKNLLESEEIRNKVCF